MSDQHPAGGSPPSGTETFRAADVYRLIAQNVAHGQREALEEALAALRVSPAAPQMLDRTALEGLVAKWRAEADRTKLLQGLTCADDLEALLTAAPHPSEGESK